MCDDSSLNHESIKHNTGIEIDLGCKYNAIVSDAYVCSLFTIELLFKLGSIGRMCVCYMMDTCNEFVL